MKNKSKPINTPPPPSTIGIILDGNRRWARERGRPVFEGHVAGYNKLKEFVGWAKELNISNVFLYVFSTENWQRPGGEVKKLLTLLAWALENDMAEFKKMDARLTFVGQKEKFGKKTEAKMIQLELETKNNRAIRVYLGLSYGGRAEIIDAVRRLTEKEKETLTEEELARYLWTREMPDPALIIRTGGEKRLSNFLLWQSAYSELFFIPTYWPDFTKKEFEEILQEYSKREQRRGR